MKKNHVRTIAIMAIVCLLLTGMVVGHVAAQESMITIHFGEEQVCFPNATQVHIEYTQRATTADVKFGDGTQTQLIYQNQK